MWLAIGSQVITHKDFSLAPLSTEGCQSGNLTSDYYLTYGSKKHGNGSSYGYYFAANKTAAEQLVGYAFSWKYYKITDLRFQYKNYEELKLINVPFDAANCELCLSI